MALIKCKGCGRMISDRATVCPHCGHPVKDSKAASSTPAVNSGAEAGAKNNVHTQPVYYDEDEPKKSSKTLVVIVIIVAVIAIGFGCFLFETSKMDSDRSMETVTDTVEMDSTVQDETSTEEKALGNTQVVKDSDYSVATSEEEDEDQSAPVPPVNEVEGEEIWTIHDTSGPTNLRESPRGEICCVLDEGKDFLIYTDEAKGNWLRVSSILSLSDGNNVNLHGSGTGEYWISKNIIDHFATR